VRKLLAKAESPACTPAEAEAFTAKAAELIAKYGIEEAMLTAADPTRDAVGDRVIVVYAPYFNERAILLANIAERMGGRAVQRSRRHRTGTDNVEVHLFGYGTDLERIELLYTSLLIQSANGLSHATVPHYEGVRAFRASWLRGFTRAIVARLDAAAKKAQAEAEAQRVGGPSTALVLADRSALVSRAVADVYPRVRLAPSALSGSGQTAGYAAGMRADIGGTGLGGQRRRAVSR
jgi:hypothetical protein